MPFDCSPDWTVGVEIAKDRPILGWMQSVVFLKNLSFVCASVGLEC